VNTNETFLGEEECLYIDEFVLVLPFEVGRYQVPCHVSLYFLIIPSPCLCSCVSYMVYDLFIYM